MTELDMKQLMQVLGDQPPVEVTFKSGFTRHDLDGLTVETPEGKGTIVLCQRTLSDDPWTLTIKLEDGSGYLIADVVGLPTGVTFMVQL